MGAGRGGAGQRLDAGRNPPGRGPTLTAPRSRPHPRVPRATRPRDPAPAPAGPPARSIPGSKRPLPTPCEPCPQRSGRAARSGRGAGTSHRAPCARPAPGPGPGPRQPATRAQTADATGRGTDAPAGVPPSVTPPKDRDPLLTVPHYPSQSSRRPSPLGAGGGTESNPGLNPKTHE